MLPTTHPYHYERNIELAGCLNLVAEERGEVIGFISVLLTRWNPGGEWVWERLAPYVGFVGVLPARQREGIGESLLRSAIREVAIRCSEEPWWARFLVWRSSEFLVFLIPHRARLLV